MQSWLLFWLQIFQITTALYDGDTALIFLLYWSNAIVVYIFTVL